MCISTCPMPSSYPTDKQRSAYIDSVVWILKSVTKLHLWSLIKIVMAFSMNMIYCKWSVSREQYQLLKEISTLLQEQCYLRNANPPED